MNCIICGSDNIKTIPTRMSGFLESRISPGGGVLEEKKLNYVIAINVAFLFMIED